MSGESPDFTNFCIKKRLFNRFNFFMKGDADIFILKVISSREIELKTLKELVKIQVKLDVPNVSNHK